MNADLSRKLDSLRADYSEVSGRAFSNFYCPILRRDESAPLCKAHIINEAFPKSDRRWTIQRADVDNFFGSHFESEFVLLAQKGKHDPLDVITNRELSRKLQPRITVSGRHVEHYVQVGEVPNYHSSLAVPREGQPPIHLVLKQEPNATLAALGEKWEIVVEKDVRLAALVSLLKAAHLTLFEILGYRYALSAAGRFMGWDVLGSFATDNMNCGNKQAVLENADKHFMQFVNLVRPLTVPPSGFKGTISDSLMFLCAATPKPWAFVVFIRLGDEMHSVVVPILEDPEGAARFVRFLGKTSGRFEVRPARFETDRWQIGKSSRILDWPEANYS